MRRLMPQFMLEVRAMARPRIPPGKISLSTNQGTGRKGRVDGEQQNDGKSTEADSQLTALCPTDLSCHSGRASYVCLSLLALAVLCPGFSLLGNPLFFVWEGGAYFWPFSLATAWHVGSYFPKQGLNSHPLHWMLRVLTTEPPG